MCLQGQRRDSIGDVIWYIKRCVRSSFVFVFRTDVKHTQFSLHKMRLKRRQMPAFLINIKKQKQKQKINKLKILNSPKINQFYILSRNRFYLSIKISTCTRPSQKQTYIRHKTCNYTRLCTSPSALRTKD